VPTVDGLANDLPVALALGLAAYLFGASLKVSDLLQEHGYRWFRGAAIAAGAFATALLLALLWRADALHRVFWLAVLLHWILRGRIDGVNHGLPTAGGLIALSVWAPLLIVRQPSQFLYFFVPLTMLGLLHDRYQYGRARGPLWLERFLENQHLYWYLVIVGHPLVSTLSVPFTVAAFLFVKGYGLFYSERARAVLPRIGIVLPPSDEATNDARGS
jgi:hypothetical protein